MPVLYKAAERLILARLEIGLIKTIHKGRLGLVKGKPKSLAGEVEMLLIAASVLIGHVTKRPRSPLEISRELGIPRATVERKLRQLVWRGVVERIDGGRFLMCDGHPPDAYAYVGEAVLLIKRAAKQLGGA